MSPQASEVLFPPEEPRTTVSARPPGPPNHDSASSDAETLHWNVAITAEGSCGGEGQGWEPVRSGRARPRRRQGPSRDGTEGAFLATGPETTATVKGNSR